MGEQGLKKQQIVQELARSAHGKLGDYRTVALTATRDEPEFMAHLIAWNLREGQIRDSKVALPVLFAQHYLLENELRENALAAIASLDPRNLVRAVRFSKEKPSGIGGGGRPIRRVVERYLRVREENWSWWQRTAVQFREDLKTLYALNHVKPNTMAQWILFGTQGKVKAKPRYPKGTIFHAIATLKDMNPSEAAGTIMERRIPFLVAFGALGAKAKDEKLVLALIERMSPTELTTNTKLLGKLGVQTVPALRAAFKEGLARAATSKKTTLKAGRAAKALGDTKLAKEMEHLQERQIDTLKGIEGDWLVLADKSSSMEASIEVSRHIAGTLARFVKGEVHLVFFNTSPQHIDVTGRTMEEIERMTAYVHASGATSIGCGMRWALDKKLNVDGIAIVSDMAENNTPAFASTYERYCKEFSKEPPVYLYVLASHYEQSAWIHQFERDLVTHKVDAQAFDLRGSSVDYYSLPNLVQTMRANRYSLIDEIMEVPLLKLDDVLKKRSVA